MLYEIQKMCSTTLIALSQMVEFGRRDKKCLCCVWKFSLLQIIEQGMEIWL